MQRGAKKGGATGSGSSEHPTTDEGVESKSPVNLRSRLGRPRRSPGSECATFARYTSKCSRSLAQVRDSGVL